MLATDSAPRVGVLRFPFARSTISLIYQGGSVMSQYEYTVVELPTGSSKKRQEAWTEYVNRVASHGWRLVTVADQDASETTYADFERVRSDG